MSTQSHSEIHSNVFYTDYDYIPLLNIKMVAGSNFSRTFADSTSVIINETAVKDPGWNDNMEVNGDPSSIMMLTNGGNFEVAMLLADGMWENLTEVFQDDICVAVPARDLLFIAGKNNPVGREGLRAMVRKFFDEQETQGLLVRHIYARENNSWVMVETA